MLTGFNDDDQDLIGTPRRLGSPPAFISGPGPQRPALDLPGIEVPKKSSQPDQTRVAQPPSAVMASANSTTSNSSTRPKASISGPTMDSGISSMQAELDRKRATGPGVNQIHNPFLRGVAKVGDIAGSILAPGITAAIPGTTLHHNVLMNQDAGAIREREGEQKTEAETQEANARANKTQAEANQESAQTPEEQAFAEALKQHNGDALAAFRDVQTAKNKPPAEKEGEMPLGDKVPQLNNLMQHRYQILHPGQALPQEFWLPLNATQKDYDRVDKALEAQERATGTKETQETSRQFREAMLEIAKQGLQLRQDAAADKKNKANPDEQKRADLAKNMNENLDALEEIVKRRPDLFGPIAGRMTQAKMAMGSDDPDVGALATIEHMLGMVQQSTHGMRSAHGVEAAAHSITQSFHNRPEAVEGAIQAARRSIQTFIDDANKQAAAGAGAGAGTAKVATADHVREYAKQKGISEDQAKQEFEKAGYTVK